MKQRMVRTAGWLTRKDRDVTKAIANMNGEFMQTESGGNTTSTNSNSHGVSQGMNNAIQFISLVDTISKYLPHTNKAASKARGEVEALSHAFGSMATFVTVTPDEENGMEVQVYSGTDIDISNQNPLACFSEEDLRQKAIARRKMSFQYPGLSSFYFSQVLRILIDKVVGWNVDRQCANDLPGLCGTPDAFVAAIEEQGRSRLHVHFGIWIKDIQDTVTTLHDTSTTEQGIAAASSKIANQMDLLASTSVAGLADTQFSKGLFDHPTPTSEIGTAVEMCIGDRRRHHQLDMVSPQQLRDMRHKEGSQLHCGIIAKCSNCPKLYTSNEIAIRYLQNKYCAPSIGPFWNDTLESVPSSTSKHPAIMDKMNALLIRTQRDAITINRVKNVHDIVNYARNTHSAMHVSSCFKYGNECRYNLCKLPSQNTLIVAAEKAINWYDWTGESQTRQLYTIREKRHQHDVFANTYCRAISLSQLHCNSNVRLLMPGPATLYTTKYLTKDTQKEDQCPYEKTVKYMQNRLCEIRKVTELSEGLSRVLGASYVHNSANVVGPPLAKYLTIHHSRFILSHDFVFINAIDMFNIMTNKKVTMSVRKRFDKTFLENWAYHYLFRPKELKHLNPIEFFEEYEVIIKPAESKIDKKKERYIEFDNPEHPGFEYQIIRLRHEPVLAKIRTFDFPDTIAFDGNILDSSCAISMATEEYAKWALLHFSSFTHDITSIQRDGSFTKRLRHVFNKLKPASIHRAHSMLSNIQDVRNNYRVPRMKDELAKCTTCFIGSGESTDRSDSNEEDDEATRERAAQFAEDLFNSITTAEQEDQNCEQSNPSSIRIDNLLNKAGAEHSTKHLCTIDNNASNSDDAIHFLEIDNTSTANANSTTGNSSNGQYTIDYSTVSRERLVTLLGRRVRRRVNATASSGSHSEDVQADGSCLSILNWSKQSFGVKNDSKFDRDQRRAFQIIVGQFVLTYYKEAEFNYANRSSRADFLNNKKNLENMTNNLEQLLLFFSGAGGSGKSEVIKQVLAYASEFCRNLRVKFDRNTIRVTALTGVAATSIGGETLDMASHIMKNMENLTPKHGDEWKETRLLIIDEVSFMSVKKLNKLNAVMQKLRENWRQAYGGLNIVFCGDFRQLEPVGQGENALYEATGADRRLWHDAINCFLELKGLHRFKDDPRWGTVLMRFREGCPTKCDIDLVNSRVASSRGVILPDNLRYATYHNKVRDSINNGLFMGHLKKTSKDNVASKDHIVILCDHLQYKFNDNEKYISFPSESRFWSYVGESDVTCGQSNGRFDPMLKLYYFCEVMTTSNDIERGIANGTQLNVLKVVLKAGEVPFQMRMNGILVNTVRASQVKHIVVQRKGNNAKTFNIAPNCKTFQAKYPIPLELQSRCDESSKSSKRTKTNETLKHVKATQVPVIVNNATTGFKLQGATVDNIFISEMRDSVKNWIYVLLSRVRTLDGLFLRERIPTNPDFYRIPAKLADMTRIFNSTCCCPEFDESDIIV